MNDKVKFVFNQTAYYGGKRYESGDVIEVPSRDADEWDKMYYGNIYKPKKSKKEKK